MSGRVAEWFKAPVLKTGRLTPRKFESCPFRQTNEVSVREGLSCPFRQTNEEEPLVP